MKQKLITKLHFIDLLLPLTEQISYTNTPIYNPASGTVEVETDYSGQIKAALWKFIGSKPQFKYCLSIGWYEV